MAKPAAVDRERYSDKVVNCDFCPSKLGYLYTAETDDACQVTAVCGTCKKDKVPEERLHRFRKWLWPKDAATLRAEMKG